MWALTYWAEAVTKRGGRVLLNVQLFDSLEPGYKRMLSPQLHQIQPRMAASICIIVARPIQRQHTIRSVSGFFFPRKDDYSQPDSQLASQLANGLTVMQLGSRCCLWRAALTEAVAHLGKQRFAGVWTHWLNKVTTMFPLQTALIMIKEHFNSHVGYYKAWKLIRAEL